MPFLRRVISSALGGLSAIYAVNHLRKNHGKLYADTAFESHIDITDLPGFGYHFVNNFWLPDPEAPQVIFQAPFPHILGPNVVNNNLNNVHFVNNNPDDYPESFDWFGPSVVGTIGTGLFHHGYARRISLDEAVCRSRRLLQRHRDEIGEAGIVVGVSVDGHVVWTEGFGYADFENQVGCTADTVMRIASIGKAISMTLIAKLWEEGKLDLDKPIQEYLPDFPQKTYEGSPVTLTCRQLVSHLSGIRHYSKVKKPPATPSTEAVQTMLRKDAKQSEKTPALPLYNEFDEPEYYIKEPFKSVADSVNLFKDDPLLGKPGEEYLYTTHGWTLLCAVLESVTKRKITDLLKDLFRDLGLNNTYLDEHEPIVYNRSRNYRRDQRGTLKNAPYVDNSYKWAGGGLLSTVGDLLRFAHLLLYSFQWQDNLPAGYLKPSTLSAMWTLVEKTRRSPHAEGGYGMGWMVVPAKFLGHWALRQPHIAYHTGGAIGASSVLTILPREERFRDVDCFTLDKRKGLPPQGVVVTIIVNLERVELYKKSMEIARIFDQVDPSELKRLSY